MSLNADTAVSLAPDVVFQEVAGEIVLLDLKNELYFGLDEVGARIFSLLIEGRTIADVFTEVIAEYEVTEDVLAADVEALLAELKEKQLILMAGSPNEGAVE